jgi:hypothetical protein
MPKHFPLWRKQIPILLMICALAIVARHVLDGYQDKYRPLLRDKPFAAPINPVVKPVRPETLPTQRRTAHAASYLGLLLSLMAEDPTIASYRNQMWPHGLAPTIYHDTDERGNAVITKALPVAAAIHVPEFAPARGEPVPEAQAVYFVKRWLRARAATNRAELTALTHLVELAIFGTIARAKGESPTKLEALTAFWVSHRELSRASTRVAELAAFEAISAVTGKSIALNGKEYVANASHNKVDVRRVAKANTDDDDP